ncbi:sugar phosphate isomerase/epimerase [Acidaminobacter sp. JC074]|uniref:sugar phosphate isomerase/epimerase family protein n=1 Tax=Acidaminobacter sp. JC074 TaxID=2530199 RepID=UPI001F0E80F8|nr:sugar phosphate isomerase/epimerase [Acidaminobacter sp. JC074]MCH4890547.1 sugar phosphate isomerase/epimerase [Acidaminobacter sp. JC074]
MIGMPALIEFDSFKENAELCHKLGLDFIEINMNLPLYSHKIDVEEIKKYLKLYDLKLTLHLSESFDPFVLDPIYRQAALDSFNSALEIAKNLGVKLLNMHMSKGIYFTLPDGKLLLNKKFHHEYLTYVQEFKSLVESSDIILCIENTGIHDLDFIQTATDILLEADNIFLTYDIGHDITSGYKDKAYFDLRRDKICHYHIHDATTSHNHLELYTGDLDIDGYISQAKNSGASCVIEVKTARALTQSVEKLKLRA